MADYLSELTMSLLAAVKAKNPQLGFTPDLLESLAPFLGEIKNQGVRVVTNGGGMNPKRKPETPLRSRVYFVTRLILITACVAMLKNICKKKRI